jgi:hypothetical protein
MDLVDRLSSKGEAMAFCANFARSLSGETPSKVRHSVSYKWCFLANGSAIPNAAYIFSGGVLLHQISV